MYRIVIMVKQRVVLSFDQDEYLPIFISLGHNLKDTNIYISDAAVLLNMPNYYIIQKKFTLNDRLVDMYLTHSENAFIRGFFYYNNKEFNVQDHKTYQSLQIEDFAYDNISVVRLLENPFFKN